MFIRVNAAIEIRIPTTKEDQIDPRHVRTSHRESIRNTIAGYSLMVG
jgi:hypothetical protein